MNSETFVCGDFLAFQDALKRSRKIDDNIIHALNTTIPTESFIADRSVPTNQCKSLWEQLLKSYNTREVVIKKCIELTSEELKELKESRNKEPNNLEVLKKLKNQQTKLRLMQSELSVEEVVKDRSSKQNVEHHVVLKKKTPREHDYRRSLSMAVGGFGFGLMGHFWYKFLDRKLPGNAKMTIAKKIGCELMLSPLFFLEAFFIVGLFEGRTPKECIVNFKNNFPLVFAVDCCIWTPLQAVNFYFLPPKYRFLYVATITLLYDVFFSFVLHKDDYDEMNLNINEQLSS
ncbi:coiled-coil domain-containing protein 58-like protein [Leptotrombidium deliense]|uniref:Protein MIX23 n=1 Tax=Leptotrombidium deliense TaxID=299467 RepID=A0A443S926_9ACAR|nr:coiled-coil domain-containing protein 58-like protein [Leptotrombidium deliense]